MRRRYVTPEQKMREIAVDNVALVVFGMAFAGMYLVVWATRRAVRNVS